MPEYSKRPTCGAATPSGAFWETLARPSPIDYLLAEALAGGDPTARDAAFDVCVSKLRAFAAALLACFPLDDARAEETMAAFPELFA